MRGPCELRAEASDLLKAMSAAADREAKLDLIVNALSGRIPTQASIAESELLPCPFCGGEAERIDIEEPGCNFGGSCICCKSCGASSPVHFDRKENLESSWNDRVDVTPHHTDDHDYRRDPCNWPENIR